MTSTDFLALADAMLNGDDYSHWDVIQALREAAQLAEATAWRTDWENAPRDGTRVLLFGADLGVVTGVWKERSEDCENEGWPTHWQPFPAPPKE